MVATKFGLCSRKRNVNFKSSLDLNKKEEKNSKMYPEYFFLNIFFNGNGF